MNAGLPGNNVYALTTEVALYPQRVLKRFRGGLGGDAGTCHEGVPFVTEEMGVKAGQLLVVDYYAA